MKEEKLGSESIKLIGYDLPQVYPLEKIFNPNNGPSIKGYFIPAVDSLIIETIDVNSKMLYVVVAVNPVTFESDIEPIGVVSKGGPIVSGYGNQICMLFYDTRQTRTRLVVDEKITFDGGDAANYQLVVTTTDGTKVPISIYVDSQGKVEGSLVPIVPTGVANISRCLNCYTAYPMDPGNTVYLELYDAAGMQISEYRLISRKALILTDFQDTSNPITGFVATANQITGSDWALYLNQNVTALTFWPKLIFQDGSEQLVPIDGKTCFIYGLEDVSTDTPNVDFKIMIKYFLSDNSICSIFDENVNRVLVFEKTIKILPTPLLDYSKISIIPTYDGISKSWTLGYAGYSQNEKAMKIIPSSDITFGATKFNGASLGVWQNLEITTKSFVSGNPNFTQAFSIHLDLPVADMPYLLADASTDELIYGRSYGAFVRPTVFYDAILKQYYISSNLFSEKSFLFNFYSQASPPYVAAIDTVPQVPTHFVLRDATTGKILITSPIEVSKYNALFNLATPTLYSNKTVLVEFLFKTATQYEIIYAVPVLIVQKAHQ